MSDDISVFVIDDSAVVRHVFTEIFSTTRGFRLAGSAQDPVFAMAKMPADWPDVILLDIEMPRMDGITFLVKLMQERPTPVVICSTLTEKGADITLKAMSAGAIEIVTKPQVGLKDFLETSRQHITSVVRAAAGARVTRTSTATGTQADVVVAEPRSLGRTTDQVVALGTSTGGTQALEKVLTRLPATCPGIVIVQHMPEKFTKAFAARLDNLCKCEVMEATDGDRVIPGRVLLAPGGLHMQLRRNGAQYHVSVSDGPRVKRHKPSVDVLFRSVARVAGRNSLGVIMTGMGDDGVTGLFEMRQAGAHTVAQDQASCVVYGMPKGAVEQGAAVEVLPLERIAEVVMNGSATFQQRKAGHA